MIKYRNCTVSRSFRSIINAACLDDFFTRKTPSCITARLEILARYRVNTLTALETKIADATVAEHPTWEDLITVENLDVRLGKIDGYLRNL